MYKQFLQALASLANKKTAIFSIEGLQITARQLKGPVYQLSTPLYLKEPKDFFIGGKSLKIAPNTPFLRKGSSTHCVELVFEMPLGLGHYLSFRKNMELFLSSAEEWQEILEAL